jgi:hypothetical protein
MRSMRIAPVFAALVFSMSAFPLRAQDSSPSTPQAPPMAMTQSCEHHQAMVAALASIEKLVAETNASKDVANLQNALDQIGSQVTKMQENMNKCSGMMDKMKKMKSMPPAGTGGPEHH